MKTQPHDVASFRLPRPELEFLDRLGADISDRIGPNSPFRANRRVSLQAVLTYLRKQYESGQITVDMILGHEE